MQYCQLGIRQKPKECRTKELHWPDRHTNGPSCFHGMEQRLGYGFEAFPVLARSAREMGAPPYFYNSLLSHLLSDSDSKSNSQFLDLTHSFSHNAEAWRIRICEILLTSPPRALGLSLAHLETTASCGVRSSWVTTVPWKQDLIALIWAKMTNLMDILAFTLNLMMPGAA